jgi:hypothetical protein
MRFMRKRRASIAGAVAECAILCGISTNIIFPQQLAAALRPLDDHRKHSLMMAELADEPAQFLPTQILPTQVFTNPSLSEA